MTARGREYVRFTLARRVEHVLMMLSFATLGLTGLIQKFADTGVAVQLVNALGGIESVRTIHHTAAVVMMLGTAWHILVAGYHVFVLRTRLNMLPNIRDVQDAWRVLLYNLGLGRTYPQMGRYTFEEKMEYWAFVWGAVIMGLTGFVMWNPITATRLLPGQFIPAAKAAHGAEAVLAVLAIIIWHMYGVHIRRFNKAMWTGRLTEAEMLHEHPLELADLKAGVADLRPDARTLRRRKLAYYPAAGLFTVIMLGAIYGFVNAEQTALTTIPPQAGPEIFVPRTPSPVPSAAPTVARVAPTSSAVGSTTVTSPAWEAGVGPLLQVRCGSCHGPGGMAGLDLTSFETLMLGGASGTAIAPGDAAGSLLVTRQEAGGHPAQLSAEELELLRLWIEAGAPAN